MKQAQVLTEKDTKRVLTHSGMRNAKFDAVLKPMKQLLRSFDCYCKLAGFEAAVDIFPVHPNARLIGAFTLKDDGVVVNSRQLFHRRCLAVA